MLDPDFDAIPEMPWAQPLGILDVADLPEVPDVSASVRGVLENPIGLDAPLRSAISPNEHVSIVVSDSFRKTGSASYLPPLIDYLRDAGIRDEHITFLIATGSHRGPHEPELQDIFGARLLEQFRSRIVVHDARNPENLVHVGTTRRGTRVSINRYAVECDRLIVTGTVVLHYFAGFGGGRKAIMPGLASEEAIAHNHALNLHPQRDELNPNVQIGVLDGNPVAEDMDEGAAFVRTDFLLNTVLNRHGKIAAVFGGELTAAHRAASRFAWSAYTAPIRQKADFVIAFSRETKNFVQTHKALFNANKAIKEDGRILLVAPCPEGLGGEQFVKWLRLESRDEIIRHLRDHSEINGQTALSSIEKGPRSVLVTAMPEEEVSFLRARRAPSVSTGIDIVRSWLNVSGATRPCYYVMPNAASTVPVLVNASE